MKRTWLCAAVVLLFLSLGLSSLKSHYVFSQSTAGTQARMTNDEQAIRNLLQEWIDALVKNDSVVRRRMMSDDFTLTAYDGRVISKAQILEAAQSSSYRIEAVKPEELQVRVYGNAAVLNGRMALTERVNGKSVTNRIQVTQTWVKRDGRWQAVAEQATRIVEE